MDKKSSGIDRMLKFFEERGFYIILFLCIGAIGISGYVLFFKHGEVKNEPGTEIVQEQAPAGKSENGTVEETPAANDVQIEVPDQETKKIETKKKPEAKKSADVRVNNPVPSPKEPFYVRPVPGTVSKTYSENKLLKDVTMNDWRVHKGVDFKAQEGERVSCVADGKVKDIYYDKMLGYCIRVSHEHGIESLYCNLMKNATVKLGDSVKAGDTIGGVGSSMLSESADAAHLHLEMTKDGLCFDPLSLLPKK
ncbi:MAG: M23 family metallopeptidase [Bacillota bacterium]|nr:M23 family metallopeptidase [Bacillota bacterium]